MRSCFPRAQSWRWLQRLAAAAALVALVVVASPTGAVAGPHGRSLDRRPRPGHRRTGLPSRRTLDDSDATQRRGERSDPLDRPPHRDRLPLRRSRLTTRRLPRHLAAGRRQRRHQGADADNRYPHRQRRNRNDRCQQHRQLHPLRLGPDCSISSGRPSTSRRRLLRRETLELAFKFAPSVNNVVAFVPPAPGQQATL